MKKVNISFAINANLNQKILRANAKYNWDTNKNTGKYEMIQKLLEIGADTVLSKTDGEEVIF